MDRRIFGGGPSGVNGPPWRLVRLSDARESEWQGTTAEDVEDTEQSTDGWITLSIDDDAYGVRTFLLRDASGRVVDPAEQDWCVVEMKIEVDSSVWSGTNDEVAFLAVADQDGAVEANKYITCGVYTSSAPQRGIVTKDSGADTTAAVSGSFNWTMASTVFVARSGFLFFSCYALRAGMSPGNKILDNGALTPTGPVRLGLGVACTGSVGAGPYQMKFRPWYRVILADGPPVE